MGRSVPVLSMSPETRLRHWLDLGETGEGELNPYATAEQKRKAKAAQKKTVIELSQIETKTATQFLGYDDLAIAAEVQEVVMSEAS